MTQKVALVTGATGFVGSHLLSALLSDGWCVHGLVRNVSILPNWQNFSGVVWHRLKEDRTNLIDVIGSIKPDVIFHLASLFLSEHVMQDIEELIYSNLLFGVQLLEAMRICEIDKIINTGTSWQHYNSSSYNPVNLYAATKQAFEDLITFYVDAYHYKVITLKLFDTYGPFDQRKKLFSLLKEAAYSGCEIEMSPGEQLIDLVYIDDVTKAYMIAYERMLKMEEKTHEIYAISSQNAIPLYQIVNKFEHESGCILNVKWGAREYRYREVMFPWKEGKQLLGWSARVTLEEGIQLILS